MEKDCSTFKTFIEFAITSHEIDLDTISDELGMLPDRSFRKGDLVTSKHSPPIGHHIEFLKSILLPKIEILKRYKEDARFSVSFLIWIETDNPGIGIDLNETETAFLNSISNGISFSLLTM
ncbi:MAG: hypothetical protein IPH59_15100 [bacterium]|nr:hypothetical protein [bacterium]